MVSGQGCPLSLDGGFHSDNVGVVDIIGTGIPTIAPIVTKLGQQTLHVRNALK